MAHVFFDFPRLEGYNLKKLPPWYSCCKLCQVCFKSHFLNGKWWAIFLQRIILPSSSTTVYVLEQKALSSCF